MPQKNDWKYNDVATYILYQQFFAEPNFIKDRRGQTKIEVEGSGEVVQALLDIIREKSDLWDQGQEEEFIRQLVIKLGVDPEQATKKYRGRLETLSPEQQDDKNFKMLMALSDIISAVHEVATNSVQQMLREEIGSEMSEEEFKSGLDRLSEMGDSDFSLLLNLAILLRYAEITNQEISSKIFFEKFEEVINRLRK